MGSCCCSESSNQSTLVDTTVAAKEVEVASPKIAAPVKKIVKVKNDVPKAPPEPHVYVWGDNQFGQIGNNSSSKTTGKDRPIKVSLFDSKMNRPVSVSSGDGHVCVITANGHLFGWGKNSHGQIGNGVTSKSATARPVRCRELYMQKIVITAVACGGDSTFALTNDGGLFSFGANEYGQLGLGHKNKVTLPTQMDVSGVKKIAAGSKHAAFVNYEKKLFLWGANDEHQLGLRDEKAVHDTPTAWDGSTVESVSCGDHCTGVVTPSRQCFFAGKVGGDVVPMTQFSEPLKLKGKGVRKVAVGKEHVLVLTSDSVVYAWGAGWAAECDVAPANGESLPKGSITCRSDPSIVEVGEAGEKMVSIAAGNYHSMALSDKGVVYAWGRHDRGQLGIGMSTPGILKPCLVRPPKRGGEMPFIYRIEAGGDTTLALVDGSKQATVLRLPPVHHSPTHKNKEEGIENFGDVMAAAPHCDLKLSLESEVVADQLRNLTAAKMGEISNTGNAITATKDADGDMTKIEIGIAANLTSGAVSGVAPPPPDDDPDDDAGSPSKDEMMPDANALANSIANSSSIPPPPPED